MNDFTTTTTTADTDIEKYVSVSKTLGSAYYLILTALILKACDTIAHALIPVVGATTSNNNDDENDNDNSEGGDSGNGGEDGNDKRSSDFIKDDKDMKISTTSIVYVNDVKIYNDKEPSNITMNPIVAEMVRPVGSIYDDL